MGTSCEVYSARLGDPDLDINLKVTIATELKEKIDSLLQTNDYTRSLACLIPVITDILENGAPVFTSNHPEQKLRNSLLETIHRLPQTDNLRQYTPDIVKLLLTLLRTENEDNAVLCLKIIIDLYRSYKSALEEQVQPFLDFVRDLYKEQESTVREVFDNPSTPASNTPASAALTSPRPASPASDLSDPQHNKTLARSMHSFKVLTECPIIVVLLFNTHRRFVAPSIPVFVPLIIDALRLQAGPQAEAHAAARAIGELHLGVSSGIRNRTAFTEFVVSQVKTMSFLAYVLRQYSIAVRPYQQVIPEFVIRIMQDCPPEASGIRKELLVATRHILSTDFRNTFVSKIDVLLNEKVLVGTGLTCHDSLRPLAFSMLADLVHHIRTELTPAQLSRTVYLYSKNLHDHTLVASIQTMCAKLLLNLIDCIMNIPNKAEGRVLLIRILDTFTKKFATLNEAFPSILEQRRRALASAANSKDLSEEENLENLVDTTTIQTASVVDSNTDRAKDGKFLLKNLVTGLKTVMFGLKHCSPISEDSPSAAAGPAGGFSPEEVDIFARLFHEGLQCFDYILLEIHGPDAFDPSFPERNLTVEGQSRIAALIKEEKDTLEYFGSVFVHIDPAVFHEVFTCEMGFFFDRILDNMGLITLAQFFLAAEAVSQNFTGILLRYLVDRLKKLGEPNPQYASVMLRLYKLVFMAVTLFPDVNEIVLQPHLGNIIMSSMTLSSKAKEPLSYFLLLRALFRSIGGGRFELLYKEVLPLLPFLLEGLNNRLVLAHKQHMTDLFVELCLTVPVRLSVLLPHLGFLMKPLVLALQAGSDLVSQGLRTLELCIDNLTQEFLDPIMSPVISSLMLALQKHLQPLPYNQQYGHSTLRILGKLGGRNRRLLKDPPELPYKDIADTGIEVSVAFLSANGSQNLSLDAGVHLAAKILNDPAVNVHYKEQAFKFLEASLNTLLDVDIGTENLAGSLHARAGNKQETEGEATGMEVDEANIDDAMDIDMEEGGEKPAKAPQAGRSRRIGKKTVQERQMRKILNTLFVAAALPSLKEQVWPYVQNVVRHFALLKVGEALDARDQRNKHPLEKIAKFDYLSTEIIVDVIVDAMSSENLSLRKLAESALELIHHTCWVVMGNKEIIANFPIFHILASRFCSCCYKQEWYRKSGGCFGISLLSSQVEMGKKWMLEHEMEFVRSLLYILKDSSLELATGSIDEAKNALAHVLKVSNQPDEEGDVTHEAKFNNLVSLLISELSNSNGAVRETVQSSFQLLADLTGTQVTDLLTPVRDRLLGPIFSKPLRALPFAMQIGHIDAITYCLALRPPFLEFNDELVRLLHEALALADAEDQALTSRTSQYKNASSLVNLRIVCIKLLSAAMACSDFTNPRQSSTRARIISVFFKSLYSKSPEVIDVANKGLKQVLTQQHKLPKDLLQAALRPILLNLSDHKRLTVSGLEGLARLLELLTNYFKVEIGRKLLDHLRQWADPALLKEIASQPLSENQESKVIVAILNIFHLLPQGAVSFLDELITAMIDLETQLRRAVSSPFREPILKFLNRYPAESVEYFYDKFSSKRHSRLFIAFLAMSDAAPLREEVVKTSETLVAKTFVAEGLPDADEHHLQGVLIVRTVAQHHSTWLRETPILVENLKELWKSDARIRRMQNEETLDLAKLQESHHIIEVLLGYVKSQPEEEDLLFDLVEVFAYASINQYSYLRRFYQQDVALKYTASRKKSLLVRFLAIFQDQQVSANVKTQILRVIINPMMIVACKSAQPQFDEILDAAMIEQIHKQIWQPMSIESPDPKRLDEDSLRIELLQLTTLILQHASHLVRSAQKDIIKFGWNLIKLDDITAKQASYVLLAQFIASYDCPSKIIIPIYVALLRANQSEARLLVKQALDIVVPALPTRIPAMNFSEKMFPTWARWTRRVLVEDGNSHSQNANIYQLLIRHPDLFYVCREQFLPQMISSLSRLGLFQTATVESKTITMDLAALILKWESRRIESQNKPTPMDVDQGSTPSTDDAFSVPNEANEYSPPLGQKETLINFLIRFTCSSPEPISKKGLGYRGLELMKECCKIWPEVQVKLAYFDRTLAQFDITEQNVIPICNSLEVLQAVFDGKSKDWFISNISHLQRLLERSLRSSDIHVTRHATPVVTSIYQVVAAPPKSSEVSSFILSVDSVVQEGLSKMANLPSALLILKATTEEQPECLDGHIPNLMKLLQRLTKEHIAGQLPNSDHSLNLVTLVLKLVKPRVAHLGDQRLFFLQCLIHLLEKSNDVEISRTILDMVTEWVQNKRDPIPTMKEKANLMVQMMNFEKRGDKTLLEEYLMLVVSVYDDPAFARSELTVRLESAFLLGCRNTNHIIRNRFLAIFDRSIGRGLFKRMHYVIALQNWEYLGQHFWLQQALEILLGSVDQTQLIRPSSNFHYRTRPIAAIGGPEQDAKTQNEELETLMSEHQNFLRKQSGLQMRNLVQSLKQMLHIDVEVARQLWVEIFPLCWASLIDKERLELTKGLIPLLAKEYHVKQVSSRPNVIQALLEGISKCTPFICLPPQLVKYLGKTYCAWHVAIELLQKSLTETAHVELASPKDEELLRECALDGLAELYSALCEDDMFYGLWRRRCLFPETNAALSYEQNGMWDKAQAMYEIVQHKARSENLSLTEPEYCLWEDHWIISTERLAQWDILMELAKHDGNTDLLFECAWRLSDWTAEFELLEQSMQSLPEPPTPRRKIFESYMALDKAMDRAESGMDFLRVCDEGIQLSLRTWHSLPSIVSHSHVPLLHYFQLFVEMQEAYNNIFQSLAQTNATNLESRAQELKGTLQTWRERLPNVWDDIDIWSDIVAWRQHVFTAINKVYLPLIPQIAANATAQQQQAQNSYAYRGYHETAWIINRFAHVARKHKLIEVCISSLTKIYTLPNIEIQEAFLKLREQAKCHLQTESDLSAGLDVINNTNMMYFGSDQKAEFYTLKGRFLSKLGFHEEANQAFSSALRIDLNVAKGWAAWGHYNDQMFKERPREIQWASQAVDCYLQAAGIYKNAKSRRFLLRILWLLSLDDAEGSVAKSFESFKGDYPVWYWITFIPQLLTSLSHKEFRQARHILVKIAKQFPQALYYLLRTQREEYALIKKQAMHFTAASNPSTPAVGGIPNGRTTPASPATPNAGTPKPETAAGEGTTEMKKEPDVSSAVETPVEPSSGDTSSSVNAASPTLNTVDTQSPAAQSPAALSSVLQSSAAHSPAAASMQSPAAKSPAAQSSPAFSSNLAAAQSPAPSVQTAAGAAPKQPWDIVDEIFAILKTAYPLLAASMETMVDQICQRLKPTSDEDIYRLIVALLNDGIQQAVSRITNLNENIQLLPVTEANLLRLAENLYPGYLKMSFENDFIKSKPNLYQYVSRLREWRDRFEYVLDNRPSHQPLEQFSHYLAEFEHQKFDDVEVPGQYLLMHRENNNDFLRIDRFMPEVDILRGYGACYKRMAIRGHNGTQHQFVVQHPAARQCRREERLMQLFRMLNGVLEKRKESRKRGLFFHLPVIIPLAPQIRIIQDDPSYASLISVFEDYCDRVGLHKDAPFAFFSEKMKTALDPSKGVQKTKSEIVQVRQEISDEIAAKMIPDTILTDFMARSMDSPSALWMIRKNFTSQMAAVTFMTYCLSVGHRYPHKFQISRKTGNIWATDILPLLNMASGTFVKNEAVPFRLTPNFQHFMTPVGVEGVFTSSLMAIAKCLTDSEQFPLDDYLSIFVRDELITLTNPGHRPNLDQNLREKVQQNVAFIVKKANDLSCRKKEQDNAVASTAPANQTILELIAQATSPQKLAMMDPSWIPQL